MPVRLELKGVQSWLTMNRYYVMSCRSLFLEIHAGVLYGVVDDCIDTADF